MNLFPIISRSFDSVVSGHSVWKNTRNLLVAAVLIVVGPAGAQQPPSTSPSVTAETDKGSILLTIFLRHDQSKPLDEINSELRRQGYYKAFPPAGIEVVSWYVMMGIGQVITLRVPADRLREVNVAIEKTAWGGYHTEFYPTYDYKAIGEAERAKSQ
ncbi:MAG: hypothetical protein WAM44_14255 [Chthoniobacterales bacterium]